MIKKLVTLGIAALLLFSVAGLTACGNKEETMGKFYSLQEAYDTEWLTVEDLRNIAYYHNNGLEWEGELDMELGSFQPTGFTPVPKNPNSLDVETEGKIKQDFIKREVECKETEHSVLILYYGTYNGCVAAKINGCWNYGGSPLLFSIDGIVFLQGDNYDILVWKEN